MARPSSPAGRMCAPPSAGLPRQRRGSGSPPPISIRASRSAARSVRAAPGLGNLVGANPLTWLVGPLINWTLNRSAARARVAEAQGRYPGGARDVRRHRPAGAGGNRNRAVQLSAGAQPPRRAARRARPGRGRGTDHPRSAARRRHQFARAARCRAHLRGSRSRAR